MVMREALEQEIGGHQLYHARRAEYETDEVVPFKLADEPLRLTTEEHSDLEKLCKEVAHFVSAVDHLYHNDEQVRELLSRGKPDFFKEDRESHYLFLRPDIIIAETGFKICEIETSPFGLGLSHALNQAYRAEGHGTIVNGELVDHVAKELPASGVIVDSDKTKAYRGQLEYMAERVFAAAGGEWRVDTASNLGANNGTAMESIYRAFYLKEYETDEAVRAILDSGERADVDWLPSLTPHLEEKALMSLIWDKRWDQYFKSELGEASVEYLRTVIPKTMIVGEEDSFIPGMPGGVANTEAIADLPRSKRNLVVKSSGYDESGSWAEGVTLLHQLSRDKAAQLLQRAVMKSDGLQIVQEFHRGKKIPLSYTENGQVHNVEVRVRLTPYADPKTGKLVSAKATGRSGTDFIHASSDSINAAVGVL